MERRKWASYWLTCLGFSSRLVLRCRSTLGAQRSIDPCLKHLKWSLVTASANCSDGKTPVGLPNKIAARLVPRAAAWTHLVRGSYPPSFYSPPQLFFCCHQNCCVCKSFLAHYRCSTDGPGCCKDHLAPGCCFVPKCCRKYKYDALNSIYSLSWSHKRGVLPLGRWVVGERWGLVPHWGVFKLHQLNAVRVEPCVCYQLPAL